MGELIQAQFMRPYDPRSQGDPEEWVCMDKRAVDPRGGIRLYRQYGGTVQALGTAWRVALGLGKPQAEVRQAEQLGAYRPFSHHLGAAGAKALKLEGINLSTHTDCKSDAGAPAIARSVFLEPDKVFARLQQIYPEIDRERFDKIAQLYQRAVRLDTPERVANELDNGTSALWRPGQTEPTPIEQVYRAPLVTDRETITADVIFNYLPKTVFDSYAAMEAGHPAYHVSMGDLPAIHEVLDDLISTDRDAFMHATAVGHAAIVGFLPGSQPGQELNIRIFENAA